MTALWKLLPLLAAWLLLGFTVARHFPDRKRMALTAAATAYAGGSGTSLLLLQNLPGDVPYFLARSLSAGAFIALFIVAALAFHRSAGANVSPPVPGRKARWVGLATVASLGFLAGCLSVFRLPWGSSLFAPGLVFLVGAGLLLLPLTALLERRVPDWVPLPRETFLLLALSLILLMSAQTPRLDIFSPLSMNVTKFVHDFVHQYFESLLIPDHPFFRDDVWGIIGVLFSQEVGFWGGVVIWFLPAALLLLASGRARLPSVTHIRQGAMRRKLLAGHFRERRRQKIVPLIAIFVLLLALYQSRFPAVEYWDPAPIEVTATAAGEIVIPRTSESVDLADGRLHKFFFRDGADTVRFFVLLKENGKLTVVLDACAICPPDGYGQVPGVVICYACKTLIPGETVGLPGGCNPVPVDFAERPDGVRLLAAALVNTWKDAVQPAKPVPGRGR